MAPSAVGAGFGEAVGVVLSDGAGVAEGVRIAVRAATITEGPGVRVPVGVGVSGRCELVGVGIGAMVGVAVR